MTDSILDLIDHAIAAHEDGPDAMRWTPNPVGEQVVAWFDEHCEVVILTEWQRLLLIDAYNRTPPAIWWRRRT